MDTCDARPGEVFPCPWQTNIRCHKPRGCSLQLCVDWAMKDTERWWWPDVDSYWPEEAARSETIAAFVAYSESRGSCRATIPISRRGGKKSQFTAIRATLRPMFRDSSRRASGPANLVNCRTFNIDWKISLGSFTANAAAFPGNARDCWRSNGRTKCDPDWFNSNRACVPCCSIPSVVAGYQITIMAGLPVLSEIFIAAQRVHSLVWSGDSLVDWVGGGDAYRLDGSSEPWKVSYAHKFDAAITAPGPIR